MTTLIFLSGFLVGVIATVSGVAWWLALQLASEAEQ